MGTEMCLKDAARFVRVLDANAAKPVYYYILRMVSTYVGLVRRMGGMFSTRTVLFCFLFRRWLHFPFQRTGLRPRWVCLMLSVACQRAKLPL